MLLYLHIYIVVIYYYTFHHHYYFKYDVFFNY